MKKYLIVACDGYYPDAGLDNIRYHTDDYVEALRVLKVMQQRRVYDYAEIIERDKFVPETCWCIKEILAELNLANESC